MLVCFRSFLDALVPLLTQTRLVILSTLSLLRYWFYRSYQWQYLNPFVLQTANVGVVFWKCCQLLLSDGCNCPERSLRGSFEGFLLFLTKFSYGVFNWFVIKKKREEKKLGSIKILRGGLCSPGVHCTASTRVTALQWCDVLISDVSFPGEVIEDLCFCGSRLLSCWRQWLRLTLSMASVDVNDSEPASSRQ
jgi:hypothetical protein